MAVTRKQKEAALAQLIDNFKKAKSVVFSQYQGTTVKDMRALRKKLTESNVAFKVEKKTLMKIAAKEVGFDQIPDNFMQGPIGLAFAMGDSIIPAKIIHDFGKDHETVKIVGAVFEGKLIDATAAKILATLPGREVLLGQLVGLLKGPISGFHNVLHSLLRNFVYVLNETQKKKVATAETAA